MRQRIQWVFACLTVVIAATVILSAQLWTSGTSSLSTSGTVSITNSGAAALDVTGGINAGSGNVGIVGTDGRVPAISSTYFAALSGANLTSIPESAITDGSVLARVGSSETITSPWTFQASTPHIFVAPSGLTFAQFRGRQSDDAGSLQFVNAAGLTELARLTWTNTPALTISGGSGGTTGIIVGNTTVSWAGVRLNSSPVQPGFLAYNSVIDVGVSNGATVDFDTESYDNAANFSADTFTAPVTGTYEFIATVSTSYTPDGGILTIALVTTSASYRCDTSDATALVTVTSHCHATVQMTAADTALIQLGVSGAGAQVVSVNGLTTPRVTWFSGRLVP